MTVIELFLAAFTAMHVNGMLADRLGWTPLDFVVWVFIALAFDLFLNPTIDRVARRFAR